MAEIDGYQAVQNWALFGGFAGAIYLYYHFNQRQRQAAPRASPQTPQTAAAPKQLPTKKAPKKPKSFEKKKELEPVTPAAESVIEQDNVAKTAQSKRKESSADDEFAKGMMKARQGVSVKASGSEGKQRERTVKPKASALTLSSAAESTDGDDRPWSPVAASPLPKASGVEDMLEPAAQGPSTLRITAPQAPAKEKVARQPKKENTETKKQRQNRQKVEQQKVQRLEEEKARKALEEKQRRSAREARGEPAKNGITNAPILTTNAWSQAASPAPAPVAPTNNVPLLDTFDAESTSSSNDAQGSTAATSTTDGVPTQWADEHVDEQLAEALNDSAVWEEVPSKQKSRPTQHNFKGSLTPAGSPIIVNGSTNGSKAFNSKANGFSALSDENDG